MALNSLISADVVLRIYPLTLPFGSPVIQFFLCPDASTKKGGIPLTGAQKRGGCVFSSDFRPISRHLWNANRKSCALLIRDIAMTQSDLEKLGVT